MLLLQGNVFASSLLPVICILCATVSQVELTPVVSGSGESDSESNVTLSKPIVELNDTGEVGVTESDNVVSVHETGEVSKENATLQIKSTRVPIKNGTISTTAIPETSTSTSTPIPLQISSNSTSNSTGDDVIAIISVSSKPLLILEEPKPILTNETQLGVVQTVEIPVQNETDHESNESNSTGKIPPHFQSYMDELLKSENATTTKSPFATLISFKPSPSPQPQQNSLFPFDVNGKLPDFSEKEMNKRRLNYWRTKHLLKGLSANNEHIKGQLGIKTSPDIFLEEQASRPVTIITSTSLSTSTPLPTGAREQHGQSIENAPAGMKESSKMRAFFSWLSNPFRKESRAEEDALAEQARVQEAILPFALNYRGDFLFW